MITIEAITLHLETMIREPKKPDRPYLPKRLVVVGLGGIGSHLILTLARFAAHFETPLPLVLIDGKSFSQKNAERQHYAQVGMNKASAAAAEIQRLFPTQRVIVSERYLTHRSAAILINDGDAIFACVDNHATRKLLHSRMTVLRDGLLISGGNDLLKGNVQLHVKSDFQDLTPPIIYLHPEIETPQDLNPGEVGCQELAASAPQIGFTNNLVAALMLTAFWNILNWCKTGGQLAFTEQYFDIPSGSVKSYNRNTERS